LTFIYLMGVFITKSHPLGTRRSFPQVNDFTLVIFSKQRGRKKKEG